MSDKLRKLIVSLTAERDALKVELAEAMAALKKPAAPKPRTMTTRRRPKTED